MIEALIKKALESLVNIAFTTYENTQQREAEQIVALEKFYADGAAATAELAKTYQEGNDEVRAAFAAARTRILGGA